MARMQDKVVVVTGASQGIGAAIALRFAEEEASLVLLDVDGERLQRTAAETGKAPTTMVADVTDETAVDKAFARVAAEFGRLDVLVNNVGGARNAKLWNMSASDWDFTIRLNLRSAFLCTRAAARMMKQRSGDRLHVAGAREGTPWTAHHTGGAATRRQAGIHGFIRDASFELAEHGIRINAVRPGRSTPSARPLPSRRCAPATTVPTSSRRCADRQATRDRRWCLSLASEEATSPGPR